MRYSAGFTLLTGLAVVALQARQPDTYRQWPAYGGGPEQMRYSSLAHITRENVGQLQVAWTYDTGEKGGLQTQPIVADGVLYALTPSHKVFALRAATGEALWMFDAKVKSQGANRGVMYWASSRQSGFASAEDGNERRVFAAVSDYVYALDARTGSPIPAFGENGRIDLRRDLGRDPARQSVRLTSPGVIYKDLMIVGGRVSEGLPASPGFIRAYDVRTGALRWTFHTIPQPSELGHDTWPKEAWTYSGGANNWAGMALDDRRGIVYVPTGSAAADFYGANRTGDNLFANSLVALNAETGKRLWHFQIVRHDTLDRDLPSPPTLATVTSGGKRVDAVVQTTKHGVVYVFDRSNGRPLFPIEDRPFPRSDVPDEVSAPRQPMPTKPKPFARQRLTREMLTTRTPEAHAWALAEFATFRGGTPFTPLAVGPPTVVFPGFDGGAEWGGSAFDPATSLLYVNSNDIPWTGALAPNDAGRSGKAVYLRDCASCHRDNGEGAPPQIPTLAGIGSRRTRPELTAIVQKGAGRMPGFPNLQRDAVARVVEYLVTGNDAPAPARAADAGIDDAVLKYRFTGYNRFMDPEGYPAVVPPWGTLNAIDLNSGDHVWNIPLGEHPALAAQGMTNTGSENYGGPVVTAGGLLFIGATIHDRKFRAFDKATGKLLWSTTLPFSGNATPAVYEVDGRQFIAIAAGGGKSPTGGSGGVYVAFALPAR
jgi:quinoprotein glucose dehydrogenase